MSGVKVRIAQFDRQVSVDLPGYDESSDMSSMPSVQCAVGEKLRVTSRSHMCATSTSVALQKYEKTRIVHASVFPMCVATLRNYSWTIFPLYNALSPSPLFSLLKLSRY